MSTYNGQVAILDSRISRRRLWSDLVTLGILKEKKKTHKTRTSPSEPLHISLGNVSFSLFSRRSLDESSSSVPKCTRVGHAGASPIWPATSFSACHVHEMRVCDSSLQDVSSPRVFGLSEHSFNRLATVYGRLSRRLSIVHSSLVHSSPHTLKTHH